MKNHETPHGKEIAAEATDQKFLITTVYITIQKSKAYL